MLVQLNTIIQDHHHSPCTEVNHSFHASTNSTNLNICAGSHDEELEGIGWEPLLFPRCWVDVTTTNHVVVNVKVIAINCCLANILLQLCVIFCVRAFGRFEGVSPQCFLHIVVAELLPRLGVDLLAALPCFLAVVRLNEKDLEENNCPMGALLSF
jgi:hypothetical protein